MATAQAAALENIAAILGLHPLAETVRAEPVAVIGLIRALHDSESLFRRFWRSPEQACPGNDERRGFPRRLNSLRPADMPVRILRIIARCKTPRKHL